VSQRVVCHKEWCGVVCRNTSEAKSVHASLVICHTYTLLDDQSQRKPWGTLMRLTNSGVSQTVVCLNNGVSQTVVRHKEWCVTKRESRIHQDGDSGILLEMPTSLVVIVVLGRNAK